MIRVAETRSDWFCKQRFDYFPLVSCSIFLSLFSLTENAVGGKCDGKNHNDLYFDGYYTLVCITFFVSIHMRDITLKLCNLVSLLS